MIKLFFITMSIFIASLAYSTESTVIPSIPETTNHVEDTISTIKVAQEVSSSDELLYKLLYENSQKANERLITTMQWSIGIVATLLFALFGAQILFNFKINKDEINRIKNDLDNRFSKKSNEIKHLFSDVEKSFNSNLKTNLDVEVNKIYDSQNLLNQKIIDDVELFKKESKKELEESFDNKVKILNEMNSLLKKNIDLVKSDLENSINSIYIDLEELGANVWEIKGVPSISLNHYVSTAIFRNKKNRDLTYTFQNIIRKLKEHDSMNEYYKKQLDLLMESVSDDYESQKYKVKELLKNIKVYRHLDNPEKPGQTMMIFLDQNNELTGIENNV